MGGLGSGRPSYGQAKAESMTRLDLRELKKFGKFKLNYQGTIQWSRNGKDSDSVSYAYTEGRYALSYKVQVASDEWKSIKQVIHVVETPCHYGGFRNWWICGSCHQKKLVLFMAGHYFVCGKCAGVLYGSQSMDRKSRLQSRAEKIKRKLGVDNAWSLDRDVYYFDKPKGMHQKTFDRLRSQANEFNAESNQLWHSEFIGKYGLSL